MTNSLVDAAKTGRPPAYWRTVIYLIVAIGVPFLLTAGVALLLFAVASLQGGLSPADIDEFTQSTTIMFALAGVFEVLAIVVTLIWVAAIDRRPVRSIGLETRRPFIEWLRGMGVGAGLMLLSVGVMAAFGMIETGSVGAATLPVIGVGGALLFFLIQGPAEEVVFRGYLLPVLGARGGLIVGIVVSSVLFGLLHALNPNVGPLPIVNIAIAGVMFALYALVEEGVWGVFGVHTAWNWMQGNVLGMAVSGGDFGPSLFRLRETGPDWLTGGAFGPEGSVIVTLLLLAISGYLGWRLWRKNGDPHAPQEPPA